MERVEPATSLVNALADEVGREVLLVKLALFAHIVNLGVWHSAAVEPYVNQVRFATHRLAAVGNKDDAVDIRAVQVKLGIVFRCVWILLHQSCCHSLVYFLAEFFDAAYAFFFFAVLGAPYRERSAPIAAAREVPVDDILKPVAETSASGGFGFPVDGLVEFYHTVLDGGGTDEPAVERIVEHRLVGTPAMGVTVGVLLALEEFAFAFKHHHDIDVERRVFLGLGGVVGVLDKLAGVWGVEVGVDVLFHPFGVEVVDWCEAAFLVDHRHLLAVAVEEQELADASFFSYTCVVGAEGGSYMHYARTVLGGHIVAKDDAESVIASGFHPRDELLVAESFEIFTLAFCHNLVFGRLAFGEHACHKGFSHNDAAGSLLVWVGGLDEHIVNRGAYTEGGVGRQSPRSGGPSDGVGGDV